ncbi:MAG: hypothetical protein ACRC4T_08335 [Cetobacterium sp.]
MTPNNKTEILHKEIDLIQNCIIRMASNSFLIKGWYFTLILGFIVFGYEKIPINIVLLISFIITIIFWILDTFFLQLERKYREKYNWIIQNRKFSNKFFYNLDPNKGRIQSNHTSTKFLKVFFSKTLLFSYGTVVIISLITLLILNIDKIFKILNIIFCYIKKIFI